MDSTEAPPAGPGGASAPAESYGEGLLPLHRCGLTPGQYSALLAPIAGGRVQVGDMGPLRGQSFVEAWDIRRHLTRVFGFTGWSTGMPVPQLAFEQQREDKKWEVCYVAVMTLTVHCTCGQPLTSHADATAGSGAALPARSGAHDLALKSAVSGALKRAAVNLGDMFGLSLYEPTLKVTERDDHGGLAIRHLPAVGRTLAPPEGMGSLAPPVHAPVPEDRVTSGDPDESGPVHAAVHEEELSPGTPVAVTPDLATVVSPVVSEPDRGQMDPEDRAAMDSPAVPRPVETFMDSAVANVKAAFPQAAPVVSDGQVATLARFVGKVTTLGTLAVQYHRTVGNAAGMSTDQRAQVKDMFDAAYRRLTEGEDRPASVEDWMTDEERVRADAAQDPNGDPRD